MPANKNRLYIGLYARDVPNTYHWAFLVSPKDKEDKLYAVRYHVVNRVVGTGDQMWQFETKELRKMNTQLLLVRILIAKIQVSQRDFEASLQRVAIIQNDPDWRCRTWIQRALEQLVRDRVLGTGIFDWVTVESECLAYVNKKKAEGRFAKLTLLEEIPTYDLIEGKETTE